MFAGVPMFPSTQGSGIRVRWLLPFSGSPGYEYESNVGAAQTGRHAGRDSLQGTRANNLFYTFFHGFMFSFMVCVCLEL